MSLEERARGTVFVDSLGSGAIRLESISDEDARHLREAAEAAERILTGRDREPQTSSNEQVR